MTVVSLAAEREARQPHWEGPVRCIGCRHEWEAVASLGTMYVECPECGEMKGHPKHPFGAQVGDMQFVCNCGSEALTAYQRSVDHRFILRCMACGADQTNAVFGEYA